jgi:uncharacterized protein YjiS (DUF1127 family)
MSSTGTGGETTQFRRNLGIIEGEVMKVLIADSGIDARRRTTSAYGNYDRAKTQRLTWGAWFWRWCARCSSRSRQREALSSLDDHLLDDIGVTRQQANVEAAKPFWK